MEIKEIWKNQTPMQCMQQLICLKSVKFDVTVLVQWAKEVQRNVQYLHRDLLLLHQQLTEATTKTTKLYHHLYHHQEPLLNTLTNPQQRNPPQESHSHHPNLHNSIENKTTITRIKGKLLHPNLFPTTYIFSAREDQAVMTVQQEIGQIEHYKTEILQIVIMIPYSCLYIAGLLIYIDPHMVCMHINTFAL